MKKLLAVFMIVLIALAGCKSSTSNDDDDNGNGDGNGNGGGNYTVSGSVRLNSADGEGISQVTVIMASITQATPVTTTTGTNGAYSFNNVPAGTYIVTVSRANYNFTPEFVTVTVTNKNVVVQTFVGTTVSTGGNAGTHSLLPLKTGASWTYDSIYNVVGFDITESEVNNVTGTMNMGNKTYWVMNAVRYDSDGAVDSEDTFYLRIENNIMYTYGTDFFTAKAAAVSPKAASIFKAFQHSDDLATIRFNVSPGTTWEIYSDSASIPGSSWSILITGRYIGTETVGSYANCARYELEYSSQSEATFGNVAGKWAHTIWLAPNIGIVKTVETFLYGETLATVELLSTITNTLKTYQIP